MRHALATRSSQLSRHHLCRRLSSSRLRAWSTCTPWSQIVLAPMSCASSYATCLAGRFCPLRQRTVQARSVPSHITVPSDSAHVLYCIAMHCTSCLHHSLLKHLDQDCYPSQTVMLLALHIWRACLVCLTSLKAPPPGITSCQAAHRPVEPWHARRASPSGRTLPIHSCWPSL